MLKAKLQFRLISPLSQAALMHIRIGQRYRKPRFRVKGLGVGRHVQGAACNKSADTSRTGLNGLNEIV